MSRKVIGNKSNGNNTNGVKNNNASSGAWSVALKIWDIVYPILMYYVTVVIVMMLMQTFIGSDNETYMLRQLVASLVAIPVVYTHYRYDRNLEGRQTLREFLAGGKSTNEQLHGNSRQEKQAEQVKQKNHSQTSELKKSQIQKTKSGVQGDLKRRNPKRKSGIQDENINIKKDTQEVNRINYMGMGKDLLWIVVVSALLGISLNNIISMTPLVTVSSGYQEANEHFYGGSVIFEVLASGITIPILEELLYRGVVYQRLKRDMPVMAAAVLSALLFGALHFNLVQFIYAFFIGLALAMLMERVGHMAAAVAGHMTANLIAILRTETGALAWSADGSAAAWAVSVVLLLVGVGVLVYGMRSRILDAHFSRG